jgi:acyl-CoA reductase-like NAD-dependent aldehyde dehydrogenase
VAVYFWNLALSLVCGNTSLWKPHESLSLTSVAVTKLVHEVITEAGEIIMMMVKILLMMKMMVVIVVMYGTCTYYMAHNYYMAHVPTI